MSRNPQLRALQWELVNHLDAMPFDEWTPEMLQVTTLMLKIAGVKPVQFVGKPNLTLVQGGA
ncbi:hypothetical protein [Mycolicibacter sinensis]